DFEALLGDSRREFSPVRSRLDRSPPPRHESMQATWRGKSREARASVDPPGGSAFKMFGREQWSPGSSSATGRRAPGSAGDGRPSASAGNEAGEYSINVVDHEAGLASMLSPTTAGNIHGEIAGEDGFGSPRENDIEELRSPLPPGFDEVGEDTWEDWNELVKKVKSFKGAAFFLKCTEGCDMMEFLLSVDALKTVQVITADPVVLPQAEKQTKAERKFFRDHGTLTDAKPPEPAKPAAPSSGKKALQPQDKNAGETTAAAAEDGTDANRTRRAKAYYKFSPLKAFLKVLIENGGLEVFLWLVRGVDLTKIQTQLFSMNLLRASPLFARMLDDEKNRGTLLRLVACCEDAGSVEKAVLQLEGSHVASSASQQDTFGTTSQSSSMRFGSTETGRLEAGTDAGTRSSEQSAPSSRDLVKMNDKFALDAGRMLCRGLNILSWDERDHQTILALIDFWQSVFFEVPNGDERIPLEELELLKNFLLSLRQYMQAQVLRGENLENLSIWIKFMKKVELGDTKFLSRVERLLSFPGRSMRQ
ncbi:unnamed protein product, partial [Amoebophrya sp. A25]